MIKIKKMLKVIPMLVLGLGVVVACESLSDDLGSQFVDQNQADAYDKAFALYAYNVNNNDTIRSDASVLDTVRLGSFKESVFGLQKVSYITQVRMSSYTPDFGKNPVVDSVVLTIKPAYYDAADSYTTTTDEDYIYPIDSVPAKKVVKTYNVKKYGNGTKPLKIKVNEVDTFLGGYSDEFYSNKSIAVGTELGSYDFNGKITSVEITKKDGDKDKLVSVDASMRIRLDKNFFQNKIINKKGSPELKDAASFIRYFKGLMISTTSEDEGYLIGFSPNSAELKIYYTSEKDGEEKKASEFALYIGANNTHISQIVYDRTGTPYEQYVMGAGSSLNVKDLYDNTAVAPVATKIFAQGMGGSSFGVKIPTATLQKLREMYKQDKVGIMSAKIRLYNDDELWDNNYIKPSAFLIKEKAKDSTRLLPDITLATYTGVSHIATYDLSTKNAYYDIAITKTLKDIIESDKDLSKFPDYFIQVGDYLKDATTGAYKGQGSHNRSYAPHRIVLKGTDVNNIGNEISNSKAVQLRIIFTKK